jgi:hypothetical protein
MTANGTVRGDADRSRPPGGTRTSLIRADRARSIDRVIDYFGGADSRRAPASPVNPSTAPWRGEKRTRGEGGFQKEDWILDHTVVPFEVSADDPEQAGAFYRKLLGWEIPKWNASPEAVPRGGRGQEQTGDRDRNGKHPEAGHAYTPLVVEQTSRPSGHECRSPPTPFDHLARGTARLDPGLAMCQANVDGVVRACPWRSCRPSCAGHMGGHIGRRSRSRRFTGTP